MPKTPPRRTCISGAAYGVESFIFIQTDANHARRFASYSITSFRRYRIMPLRPVPKTYRFSPARLATRPTLEREHCQRCESSREDTYSDPSLPTSLITLTPPHPQRRVAHPTVDPSNRTPMRRPTPATWARLADFRYLSSEARRSAAGRFAASAARPPCRSHWLINRKPPVN